MKKKIKLTDFFTIETGDYHATKELEEGDIPLISCGEDDNGLVGYYDIPEKNRYSHVITVAYNGRPLTANYHPYEFGAKDDVGILMPLADYSETTLIYVASVLEQQKWRYSYGRKCYNDKLEDIRLELPLTLQGDLDEEYIESVTPKHISDFLTNTKNTGDSLSKEITRWKDFHLSELFHIDKGTFHRISGLEKGEIPLVSCSKENNGVVGYYDIDKENTFEDALTVTFDGTYTLTPRYHNYEFAAYDNVGVLKPKEEFSTSLMVFAAGQISLQRWRYSYGRKCYTKKLKDLTIQLPVNRNGDIDTEVIQKTVNTVPYTDTTGISTMPPVP